MNHEGMGDRGGVTLIGIGVSAHGPGIKFPIHRIQHGQTYIVTDAQTNRQSYAMDV